MAFPENIRTIVLANTAEAFSAPIGYISNSMQRQERIRIENVLSQRAFFWEGDDKLVVTPTEIPTELLRYNMNVLGLNNVANRSPRYKTHNLCENIMSDDVFLRELIGCIQLNPGASVTAYAYTKEFHALLQKLQAEDIDFEPTEGSDDISIVPYLDSKSGFRQVLSSVNGVLFPPGFICANLEAVKVRIVELQSRNIPFVIKANEGESGWGLFIGKGSNLLLLDQFLLQFNRDGIWKSSPYVIEEYINSDKSKGGGSPSTELHISSKKVEVTYNCAQLFNKEGEFNGIALGNGVLDAVLQQRMENMAISIGERYQGLGYRGFFDVDFAVSNNSLLYALETNARRTGGTHVFDLARRLFGHEWGNYLFYSNDAFTYANKHLSAVEILAKSRDLLFPVKGTGEGLVLSLLDPVKPIMGYVLIGINRQSINRLESALLDIFPVR